MLQFIKKYSPDIFIISGILLYVLFKFRDCSGFNCIDLGGHVVGDYNYLTLEFICAVLIVIGLEILIRRIIVYRKK